MTYQKFFFTLKFPVENYCRTTLLILCIFHCFRSIHYFLQDFDPLPKKKFFKYITDEIDCIRLYQVHLYQLQMGYKHDRHQTTKLTDSGLYTITNLKTTVTCVREKKRRERCICNYLVSMFNLHIDQSQLLAGWYKQFPCFKNKIMTIDGHWTPIFCPRTTALVATGEIILHLQLNTIK